MCHGKTSRAAQDPLYVAPSNKSAIRNVVPFEQELLGRLTAQSSDLPIEGK